MTRAPSSFAAAVVVIVLLGASAAGPASTPAPLPQLAPPFDVGYGRETRYETGVPALDGLQSYLHPTLEANRKEFIGRSGPVKGFGAGTHYPQVWIRDSATLILLSRYHYPREFLTSWIVEHLSHQGDDGLLNDWVAVGGPDRFRNDAPRAREVHRSGSLVMSADRNTSSTDQESALVDAAARVTALLGDAAWLQQPVAGRRVIDRLDQALGALYGTRYSPRERLLTGAFTADWGDVTPAYGDQRVIYQDESTPIVAGLYMNAYFAASARSLSVLHARVGQTGRGRFWAARAAAIRQQVDGRLWQPARGFYRVNLPVHAPAGFQFPEEGDRFALGGNALAALGHVASDAQSARIFAAAAARQGRFGMSTVASVLLPPYPAGFFKHPILKEEFTYQNGGQWDWFAGRLILAEYERGSAARASLQLAAIAERIAAAGGLYEWNTREGAGRGNARYAGSAGALGGAVLAGLFGVDLDEGRFALTVRLGDRGGRVRAYQPATDTYVAYEYWPARGKRRLGLRYGSNAQGGGAVRILLPPRAAVASVQVDGSAARDFKTLRVGADRYLELPARPGTHIVEVRLRP